jgi:RNA recognition motif-containing protein
MDNQNKIYVGNLSYSVTSDQLREIFAEFGDIIDAVVITDKYKDNRSKGFGFVEFKEAESAQKAIDAMNQKELEGRKLVVNVARPQKPRE